MDTFSKRDVRILSQTHIPLVSARPTSKPGVDSNGTDFTKKKTCVESFIDGEYLGTRRTELSSPSAPSGLPK